MHSDDEIELVGALIDRVDFVAVEHFCLLQIGTMLLRTGTIRLPRAADSHLTALQGTLVTREEESRRKRTSGGASSFGKATGESKARFALEPWRTVR